MQARTVLNLSLITLSIAPPLRASALFHVLDLVPVNVVLYLGNDVRGFKPALQLMKEISNIHCEHVCFA